jgi:hypothetical protein
MKKLLVASLFVIGTAQAKQCDQLVMTSLAIAGVDYSYCDNANRDVSPADTAAKNITVKKV